MRCQGRRGRPPRPKRRTTSTGTGPPGQSPPPPAAASGRWDRGRGLHQVVTTWRIPLAVGGSERGLWYLTSSRTTPSRSTRRARHAVSTPLTRRSEGKRCKALATDGDEETP